MITHKPDSGPVTIPTIVLALREARFVISLLVRVSDENGLGFEYVDGPVVWGLVGAVGIAVVMAVRNRRERRIVSLTLVSLWDFEKQTVNFGLVVGRHESFGLCQGEETKSEKACVRRVICECKPSSDLDFDSAPSKGGNIRNHHLEEHTEVV
jgi:hypothetical protein